MLFEKLAGRGSRFLGTRYPIISGAMTWISDIPLVEAVARNGAFPVLAGGNMPPELFEQQIRFGADALILEGSEAGGHVGYVSLMVLLQQVLFKVERVPIFVGGGLGSGKMMAHLLLMGAAGCQFGTLFVMAEECTANPAFKEAFIKARARAGRSRNGLMSRRKVTWN